MNRNAARPPASFALACRRLGVRPTRWLLVVHAVSQRMQLFEQSLHRSQPFPQYTLRRSHLVSTSRFGLGQRNGSSRTPLGLHRIAEKIGGGWPVGAVFRSRQRVGFTWQGLPDATIVHRILWLDGLEPGYNRGGDVDTHARYIYLHGFSDETTLGRPMSHGCVHVAASDLLPLFDQLPTGTLVWINPD